VPGDIIIIIYYSTRDESLLGSLQGVVDYTAGDDRGPPESKPNGGVTPEGKQGSATPVDEDRDYEAQNIPPSTEKASYNYTHEVKRTIVGDGPNRFLVGYKMLADEQWRWRYSLRSTVRWGITMIIVGYAVVIVVVVVLLTCQ
jgi:hypothetical protein